MRRREFLAQAVALPLAACSGVFRAGGLAEGASARLGASTACMAGTSLLGSLAELRGLGFQTVELITYTGASHSVGEIPGFDFQQASSEERAQVFAATRAFRHLSGHLPFTGLRLFTADAEVRQAGLTQIRGALDGLAFLRGELGVLHVGSPDPGVTYRDIWTLMVDTLWALGDYAGERGLRIGIETMQPSSVAEYAELIFAVDHPAVGATIDTGHIRGATDIGLEGEQRFTEEGRARFNEVLERLVATVGEKVVHVHLSDVRARDWFDHRAVGSGVIDFPRFLRALDRVDYPGLLVFELEEPDRVGALVSSKLHVERGLAGLER